MRISLQRRAGQGIAAALALTLAVPAQAATPCLSEAELHAATAYALPSALGGLVAHCTPHLGAGSYLRGNGARSVTRYSAGKAVAWPLARTTFLKLAGQSDRQNTDLMEKMPDAALQPLAETMFAAAVAGKLKPAQCGLADKLVRLLAPLPTDNAVELIGTLVALSASEPKDGIPVLAVCKG